MIRIIIRDPEPLWPVIHLRLPIVRMSKIFNIKPYAIATPDAHLRCGANPNVTHYTIFKTLLDKLLYSKMLEPKSLAAVSPQTGEPTVPGGYFTVFLKIGVDAEINMGGVTLLGQVAVTRSRWK